MRTVTQIAMSVPIIHDIRKSKVDSTSVSELRSRIIEGLSQLPKQKYLPSELLYDTKGLEIYEHSVGSEWLEGGYYLYSSEKGILETYGDEVATELSRDKNGRAVIIELGAGSLEKTSLILKSLADQIPETETPLVAYYALDIDYPSLIRSLTDLQMHIGSVLKNKIATEGMWGTWDDTFKFLQNSKNLELLSGVPSETPVHIIINRERDVFILAIDRAKPKDMLEAVYGAHFTPWIMNGLNLFIGNKLWERWTRYNEDAGRIEHGYKSTADQIIAEELRIEVVKDEIVRVLISNKEIKTAFEKADMVISRTWMDAKEWYYLENEC
ncbi:hypothetical protein BDQ17DRAFT_1353697 [Cyathus striatus]|nr:hypothetical protein BDQ17DRAFT_1353697 [Cyathus striatus]